MSKHAELDEFDRRIIAELQRDGRISNVALAGKVGLSPSPCLRRVKLLEESGVIRGYRAVLDRVAVGLGMTVFIEITIARHSTIAAEILQHRLEALPGCVSCHLVSGASDFLVEMVVRDMEDYERTITTHLLVGREIAAIRSNFSMRHVRVDGPLSLPV
ncbi:Lrp/AsnC family transcriptional regulator [Paracoccus sp. S1E-3]|uniref:Lrp/AsnC family transcriptional regulator n=1 Tax=Paracoccus sp. S1E-3 TaxID=2756130 RepID=UPI0015EF49C9|nr:Lrp/AsnC family transcriptional regulator [Paracoccus sp. S1E-3]MBA4490519.1 Lrp/AsnC family transcriptional regulator [Paracoccus sp. S1E-3]